MLYISHQVAGEKINTEPPGRGEQAAQSRQEDRFLVWSQANTTILEANQWPFITD